MSMLKKKKKAYQIVYSKWTCDYKTQNILLDDNMDHSKDKQANVNPYYYCFSQ